MALIELLVRDVPVTVRTEPLIVGWCAVNDRRYDGAPDAGPQQVGFGETEDDAIMDLLEQIW